MASKDDNFNQKLRAYIEYPTKLRIQPVLIYNELQEILCMDCPENMSKKYIGMAENLHSLDRKFPIHVHKNSLLLYGIISHLTLRNIWEIHVPRGAGLHI